MFFLMEVVRVLILPVVFFSSAAAASIPAAPDVFASLEHMTGSPNEGLELTCGLRVAAPACLVGVDILKSRLTLFDSSGAKAGDSVLGVWSKHAPEGGVRRTGVGIASKKWKPSPSSRWLRVKGTVAVVVAQESFSSKGAVLAATRGSVVPIVLNVNGVGGVRSVPAQLSVRKEYSRKKDENGKMTLSLEAAESLSIGHLDMFTSDDGFKSKKAVDGRLYGIRKEKEEAGRHVWVLEYVFSQGALPGKKIGVDVSGAASFRHVNVPVDVKTGLCGELRPDGNDLIPPEKMPYGENPSSMTQITEKMEWPVTMTCDRWGIDSGGRLLTDIRMSIKPPLMFLNEEDVSQQLDVTDSTGKKLFPALIVIKGGQRNPQSACSGEIWGRELATAGASWGRIHGVLHMPAVIIQESAVYEMAFISGGSRTVELPVQQPVHDGGGPYGDDVAVIGDIPTGVMTLKSWERIRENGKDRISLELALDLDRTDFEFDMKEFVFLDGKGKPIKADCAGLGEGWNGREGGWSARVVFDDPGGMDMLRVKCRYWLGKKLVPVPVDMMLGLGGFVLQKKDAERH